MPSFSKSLPVLLLVGASALAGPIARDQSAAYIEHCFINGQDCSLYFKELDPKSTFCFPDLNRGETVAQLTKCHDYKGTSGVSSGAQSKSGVTVGGSGVDGDPSGRPGLSIGDANPGPNQQSPAECTNDICVSYSGSGSPSLIDLWPSSSNVGHGSQSDSENGIDENVNESGSGSSFVPSLAFDSSLKSLLYPSMNIGLGTQSGPVSSVNVHDSDMSSSGPNESLGGIDLVNYQGLNGDSSDANVSIQSGGSNGTGAHVGNGQSIDPNAALGSNDGVTRVSLQTGSNNDPTSKIGSNGGLAPKIVSIDGTTPKINSNDGATPQTGDDDSDCGCKEVL